MNWNLNIQRQLGDKYTLLLGYVGSRSLHLSAAADDINLVQPAFQWRRSGFPLLSTCIGHMRRYQSGTRIDPNWGGGAGIRPVLYDGASSYRRFSHS